MAKKVKDNIGASKAMKKAFQLVSHGELARSTARKFGEDIARKVGLNPDTLIHNTNDPEKPLKVFDRAPNGGIKSPERIVEKSRRMPKGDVNEVRDVVRYRCHFKDPSTIWALRGLFESDRFKKLWANKGIEDIKIDDCFAKPKKHGYIGYHINFTAHMKGGRTVGCEIQFMHENMQITDKYTRAVYEEIRQIKEAALAALPANERKKIDVNDDEAVYAILSDSDKTLIERRQITVKRAYEDDAASYNLLNLREEDGVPSKKRRARDNAPRNER